MTKLCESTQIPSTSGFLEQHGYSGHTIIGPVSSHISTDMVTHPLETTDRLAHFRFVDLPAELRTEIYRCSHPAPPARQTRSTPRGSDSNRYGYYVHQPPHLLRSHAHLPL